MLSGAVEWDGGGGDEGGGKGRVLEMRERRMVGWRDGGIYDRGESSCVRKEEMRRESSRLEGEEEGQC